MRGTHCTCFNIKYNKSFYFDPFGRPPDSFLFKQPPLPINFHEHKNQVISSRLRSVFCLYFFYLIERMVYYNAAIKM